MNQEYIPGTCNISGAQLFKRKRFLAKCLGITVWCIVLIEIFATSKLWRLSMAVPFTLCAVAFQQVYFKFCYVFGWKGLFGMGELGKTQKVQDAEFRKADRAKALRMILTGILIGVTLTVAYFLLP